MTSSVGGILVGMVLWLKYPAVRWITVSPVDMCRRLWYLQVVSNLFPPASRLISLPSGTPHEVSTADVRCLITAMHHVGEDPQNCPMPLWWPKVKTRTDGPLRLNVLRDHAKDDRYSGTGPPPNVGPFATLSQPVNQSVCLTAVLAIVRGTSVYTYR